MSESSEGFRSHVAVSAPARMNMRATTAELSPSTNTRTRRWTLGPLLGPGSPRTKGVARRLRTARRSTTSSKCSGSSVAGWRYGSAWPAMRAAAEDRSRAVTSSEPRARAVRRASEMTRSTSPAGRSAESADDSSSAATVSGKYGGSRRAGPWPAGRARAAGT